MILYINIVGEMAEFQIFITPEFIECKIRDSIMFSIAINCMSYRISVDKHPLLGSCVNRRRLQIDTRVCKRAPPMKRVAENVRWAMEEKLEHFHPIRCHCSVEGQLFNGEKHIYYLEEKKLLIQSV